MSICPFRAKPQWGGGKYEKFITVDLGDPATRAASALSGEGAIEDATLFVWQHNAKTDETTLYQKAYAEASTFEFSLLFSDQTEYTYSINAWANMGELDAEPTDGDILFSNEESSGLQMKGSKSSIDQASASAVTIDMKRFAGKITVAEVALEWTNEQNALQEFTLKSIYVANAGDKAEGAAAAYNVDGAYVSSAMDAMLYSPVNSVIADGSKYETAQMLYAYGSGSTAIVLECVLGGQSMYYHVPYEPEWNTHRVFRFTVRQAGASEPLGELPDEAIEANVTTLNVLDWDEDEQEADFGEAPLLDFTPYLTFSADVSQTVQFDIFGYSSSLHESFEYSVGNSDWKTMTLSEYITFGGSEGDFRMRGKSLFGTAKSPYAIGGSYNYFKFGSTVPVFVSGDIRTLIDWENYETVASDDAAFMGLFKNCSCIVSAPLLPLTSLKANCYYEMFLGCTLLAEAPELPANELNSNCYNSMFKNCIALVSSPVLPAKNLVTSCYSGMFSGCTFLNKVTIYATDISAVNCLSGWLAGVAATGMFIQDLGINYPVGSSGVPDGWTLSEI